ncbi:hypothetical protein ACHAQF_007014 [Verticillium nonalfalfae]
MNPYQVNAETIPKGTWAFCLTSKRYDTEGRPHSKLVRFGYILANVATHLQRLCDKPRGRNGRCQLLKFENSNIIPLDESSSKALEDTFKEVCARLHGDPQARGLWGKDGAEIQEATPVIGAPIPFNMIYGVVPLFGIVTSGAHLNAFHGEGENMIIWLAQRGASKSSYPNCFDQIVAGGNDGRQDQTPLDIILREAKEEVKDDQLHQTLIKAKGPDTVITYHVFNPTAPGTAATIAAGKIEPGIRYVFDYEVRDPNHVFKKNEDDIAHIKSYTVTQVKDMLRQGQFKPNCGLVMLNFLVRKGRIGDDDPLYQETERGLEFPYIWKEGIACDEESYSSFQRQERRHDAAYE